MKISHVLALGLALGMTAANTAVAETLTLRPREKGKNFVERVTGHKVARDSEGHDQVAETTQLVKGRKAWVAFTLVANDPQDTSENNLDVELDVFVNQSGTRYEALQKVVACEVEGGTPTVRSFFYVTLKTEKSPVIAVICRWPQHPQADCQLGDEVRFFRVSGTQVSAVPMESYKKLFYVERKPEPSAEVSCIFPRFDTAKEVKALLAGKP